MAVGVVQSVVSSGPLACGCKEYVNINRFDELVLALKEALGPSSGLTSEDVDVEHLTRLMKGYDTNGNEWFTYALGDESRGYTRNLVDEGNGKSNLVSVGKQRPTYMQIEAPNQE